MKFVKFLLGLLLTVILSCVIGALILIILLTDYEVKQPEYLLDNNELTVGENLISKALDTTGDDKNLNFTLTEMEVNTLLKSIVVEANNSLSDTPIVIDTAFVTLKDDKNIGFKSYVSISGIRFSLSGNFTYTLGKSSLIFRIDQITLSKITMNYSLLNSFNVNKQEIQDMINPEVKDLGLNINFEEDVLTIYVQKDIYKNLFNEQLKDLDNPILNNVLFDGLDFTLGKDSIGLSTNINDYTIDPMNDFMPNLDIDFSYYCGKLNILLKNNVIDLSEVDILGNYLIKGYSNLNDEDKKIIDNLDLSSVGIFDNDTYNGAKDYTDSNLEEVLVSQVPTMSDRLYITELEINQNLMQNDFVGTISFFAREENGKYILNYISIDSIYVDIRDRELDLYFIININGAKVSVKLITFLESSDELSVSFDIDKLKIGNVEMEEDTKREVIDYLSTSLDYDWLKVQSNQKINFDFTTMFAGNNLLNNVQNLSTETYILLSGNKTSGQLEFVFE